MKFKCSETYDAEKARMEKWHDCFALWPRRIDIVGDYHVCAWMEMIERRRVSYDTPSLHRYIHYEYRRKA